MSARVAGAQLVMAAIRARAIDGRPINVQ